MSSFSQLSILNWNQYIAYILFAGFLQSCQLLNDMGGNFSSPGSVYTNPSFSPFTLRHWNHPIAPTSPEQQNKLLESGVNLSPPTCGNCHIEQHQAWQTSLHSKTTKASLLWQWEILSDAEKNTCLNCHSPLREARERLLKSGQNVQYYENESFYPKGTETKGLVCASCHLREGKIYGPPPNDLSEKNQNPSNGSEQGLPHGGFVSTPEMESSEFCASCHESPESAKRIQGKKIMDLYSQWLESPARAKNQQCQNCHMPNRDHSWKGISDPEFVKASLQLQALTLPTGEIQISLKNLNVGHSFPGYSVPKAYLWVLDSDSSKRMWEVVIGRELNLSLDSESFDTRLKPLEERTWKVPLPRQKKYRVMLFVHPKEHYERLFQYQNQNLTLSPQSRQLLLDSLAEIESSPYLVTEILQKH